MRKERGLKPMWSANRVLKEMNIAHGRLKINESIEWLIKGNAKKSTAQQMHVT